MIVKLSHAIVITLLLYFVAGVSNASNVQSANEQMTNAQMTNAQMTNAQMTNAQTTTAQTADAPSEPELVAESELKEISNRFVRAISQGR
jgi:uncharacterized membrane protein YoaK (UPF0700 family)